MKANQIEDEMLKGHKDILKGAKQGQVVTRFPPEPSGFLHIGHVKAAMLNYLYAKIYGGKMILRFDDTNPVTEKIEFVENIMHDLKTLDIQPDHVSHTSDFFPQIVEYMFKMIKDGNAYADCGTAEEMKDQRDNGIESTYRQNSSELNAKIFQEMIDGKFESWGGKNWCIRGKMNMQDKFKCLRDPVFFRTKNEAHHRHGTKYKAYPTYDFACPIVDALEGVTHAMRTIEYHDRNDGYHWVQKVLGLRSVEIYDYSRLNLVSTVLSKRNLKWFVDQGIADGWADPRFPTVQGIMRRGMTTFALKKFMLEQGPSKSTNLMEWDKLWAYNKDYIDPISPRYTAIVKETSAKIIIDNFPDKNTTTVETHPLHQKNEALGTKAVLYGENLWVEKGDASEVEVGEKITLLKWGNAIVTKKEEINGELVLHADLLPDDKDFKKTKKLTWITDCPKTTFEVTLVELDHLITKKKVEENESVQDIVNRNSYISYTAIAEGNMKFLKKGDKIQLERRGYFFVDKIEIGNQKMTLNFIPDGKQKNMSKIESKLDQKLVSGGNTGVKTEASADAAKDKKKKQGADDQKKPEAGEEGELSKKELNKLKRKEKISNAKEALKGDGENANNKKDNQGPKAQTEKKTFSKEQIEALNFCENLLKTQKFLGDNQLSSLDKDYLEKLAPIESQLSAKSHPNTFAWYCFASNFSQAAKNLWPKVNSSNDKKQGKDEEFDDLFGDNDDDGEAVKKAVQAAKDAKKGKKKEVIAMSLVLLEVKPLDDQTNLDELAKKIYAEIILDGLFWKEYKKEPVAFGIFKLIICFSCEDEKISVDDIVEKIESFEDQVQSVEIAAFNKI